MCGVCDRIYTAGSDSNKGVGGGNTKACYFGTMGHTLHKRIMEHKIAVDRRRMDDSALAKHMEYEHQHEEPMYSCNIVCGSRKNLERYILEALTIESNFLKGINIINGKGEWDLVSLPWITIDVRR